MKHTLSERLAVLRAELFGDRGGPELARRLGLPIRTWYNYEGGVTVPGEVILKLIEMTSIEPMWLMHGTGPKFRRESQTAASDVAVPAASVDTLLRTALTLLERRAAGGDGCWMEVCDDAMAPIIAKGASVAIADIDEPAKELDGKLVVVFVGERPVVRWFRHHGRFAVLRPEKAGGQSAEIVMDLEGHSQIRWPRRVVRINTPH